MATACTSSRHVEWDCLAAYYQKDNFTQEKWCDACVQSYGLAGDYRVSKKEKYRAKGKAD